MSFQPATGRMQHQGFLPSVSPLSQSKREFYSRCWNRRRSRPRRRVGLDFEDESEDDAEHDVRGYQRHRPGL